MLPVGLAVHYTGANHTFQKSGNRVEYGLKGKVSGPANKEPESRVKVMFDGNPSAVEVRMATLSRDWVPSIAG